MLQKEAAVLSVLSNLANTLRQSEPMSMLSAAIDRSYGRALREDGLLERTLVNSARGWVPVEAIAPGDLVMTFDAGPQPVTKVLRATIARAGLPQTKAFVMQVPAGVLGNDTEITLMPNQEVIVESDEAEVLHGDPFVLIPAMMLEGYQGIRRRDFKRDLSLYMMVFAREQIVPVAGGALVACRAQADFSPFGAAARSRREGPIARLPGDELERLAAQLRGDTSESPPARSG